MRSCINVAARCVTQLELETPRKMHGVYRTFLKHFQNPRQARRILNLEAWLLRLPFAGCFPRFQDTLSSTT